MKKLLLFIITVTTLTAKSQTSVYHPFPDSAASWNVTAQSVDGTYCPDPPPNNPVLYDYYISYSFMGDTIINSMAYHKVLRTGSIHQHCWNGNYINSWYPVYDYAGAIRQDTAARKVYFVRMGFSTECLLYDFSLNVGDSIADCLGSAGQNCAIVNSIDSVLVGNNYRKRFNLAGGWQYSLIEGIGSTSGLLEPFCPFEYIGNLICFSQYGQALYPDTVTKCNLISGVENVQPEKHLAVVFPNPVTDELNVTINNKASSEIILYDLASRKVLHRHFVSTVTLNTEKLEKGVYIYEVRGKDGYLIKGKVVKQ